jgi:hypothetical protein
VTVPKLWSPTQEPWGDFTFENFASTVGAEQQADGNEPYDWSDDPAMEEIGDAIGAYAASPAGAAAAVAMDLSS